MEEFKRKEHIKLLSVTAICLLAIIGVVTYTFSFFEIEAENTTVIKGEAATANLTVNVNKIAPSEETELGLIPQLSEYITTAVVGRNNKSCIDDNGNEVCQVYQIHVTNVSTTSVNVDGIVNLTAGSNSNLKWAQISHAVNTQNQTKPTLLSEVNNHDYQELVTNETFTGGQEKDYYIVVWIEETGSPQTDRGEFSGVVRFATAVPPQGYEAILSMIENRNTDTPDFTKTSCSSGCEEATVGLYEYQDDLGTSYYFRGDVENNYVKFGKWNNNTPDVYYGYYSSTSSNYIEYSTLEECQNASSYNYNCTLDSRAGKDMYWRIIRINGDGTVRMIYDGTQAWENGASNVNRQIGTSKFNIEYGSDNAYVGYMYGQTGVMEAGTAGYNLTHSNDKNSIIKTYLEGGLYSNNTGWYYENIVATGYHDYVADAIYCNDRSLGSSGTGIGQTYTEYGAYERLYRDYTTSVNPQLTCTNSNDRFTISASTLAPTDGQGTNKKLKYPVGLITPDEVVLAGGKSDADNTSYYLYNGQYYWTMAPSRFWDIAFGFEVSSSGRLHDSFVARISPDVVRAVISLRSDALKFGDGTIGNEFRITE